MVDFAGKTVDWVDRRTGVVTACEVLVCTLPYCGHTFACAVCSQSQEDVVHRINEALRYFGGLPQVIRCDNLKSYVKKSDRYEPIFTDFCTQFAAHYGGDLQATRVGKPQDKAGVERQVRHLYQRLYALLRNRLFHSLDEIKEAFVQQLSKLNVKQMQGKGFSRLEKFDPQERLLSRRCPIRCLNGSSIPGQRCNGIITSCWAKTRTRTVYHINT